MSKSCLKKIKKEGSDQLLSLAAGQTAAAPTAAREEGESERDIVQLGRGHGAADPVQAMSVVSERGSGSLGLSSWRTGRSGETGRWRAAADRRRRESRWLQVQVKEGEGNELLFSFERESSISSCPSASRTRVQSGSQALHA